MDEKYVIKKAVELGWAVLIAISAFFAQLVATSDPNTVLTEPRTYIAAAVAGLARVAVAAARNWLTENIFKPAGG